MNFSASPAIYTCQLLLSSTYSLTASSTNKTLKNDDNNLIYFHCQYLFGKCSLGSRFPVPVPARIN